MVPLALDDFEGSGPVGSVDHRHWWCVPEASRMCMMVSGEKEQKKLHKSMKLWYNRIE
jgi:hypothetical protein